MSFTLYEGDARAALENLESGSVQCIVTSPPYFGLRDYGIDGQIGAERTLAEYVKTLTSIFHDARRVLAEDGTLWLNLGDSYNAYNGGRNSNWRDPELYQKLPTGHGLTEPTLKPTDLLGVPWRVAFALQDDGWYLRSDIVWAKPNAMPESVKSRPTKAHEFVFLLTKSDRYKYNADAIREPADTEQSWNTARKLGTGAGNSREHRGSGVPWAGSTRNKRSVWTIPTRAYAGAHFATYPPDLVAPCILAGSAVGDTVLDPFNGTGTTGQVALELGRKYIGVELNPEYAAMTRARLAPLTAQPRILEPTV